MPELIFGLVLVALSLGLGWEWDYGEETLVCECGHTEHQHNEKGECTQCEC